ncbi:MAG: hypothetical protein NUV82_04710 [Candidatus Komeilibacteria bacterium]|nr:hypothetical protein [Candidatus Komeilibacteria bacterium]
MRPARLQFNPAGVKVFLVIGLIILVYLAWQSGQVSTPVDGQRNDNVAVNNIDSYAVDLEYDGAAYRLWRFEDDIYIYYQDSLFRQAITGTRVEQYDATNSVWKTVSALRPNTLLAFEPLTLASYTVTEGELVEADQKGLYKLSLQDDSYFVSLRADNLPEYVRRVGESDLMLVFNYERINDVRLDDILEYGVED